MKNDRKQKREKGERWYEDIHMRNTLINWMERQSFCNRKSFLERCVQNCRFKSIPRFKEQFLTKMLVRPFVSLTILECLICEMAIGQLAFVDTS